MLLDYVCFADIHFRYRSDRNYCTRTVNRSNDKWNQQQQNKFTIWRASGHVVRTRLNISRIYALFVFAFRQWRDSVPPNKWNQIFRFRCGANRMKWMLWNSTTEPNASTRSLKQVKWNVPCSAFLLNYNHLWYVRVRVSYCIFACCSAEMSHVRKFAGAGFEAFIHQYGVNRNTVSSTTIDFNFKKSISFFFVLVFHFKSVSLFSLQVIRNTNVHFTILLKCAAQFRRCTDQFTHETVILGAMSWQMWKSPALNRMTRIAKFHLSLLHVFNCNALQIAVNWIEDKPITQNRTTRTINQSNS